MKESNNCCLFCGSISTAEFRKMWRKTIWDVIVHATLHPFASQDELFEFRPMQVRKLEQFKSEKEGK